MKLLVVSEEKSLRNSLREILEMEGYEVSTALNWKEGLLLFENESFDVVLITMNTTDLTGLDFLAALKQRNISEKVIVLAREIEEGVRESCLKMGAYGMLKIPIDINELLGLFHADGNGLKVGEKCRDGGSKNKKKTRVLIISEERAICNSLSEILKMEGYYVSATSSLPYGHVQYEQEEFEVAIVSLDNQYLNELEIVDLLKQRRIAKKIILISGKPGEGEKDSCLRKGAYGFLEKPIDLGELLVLMNGR